MKFVTFEELVAKTDKSLKGKPRVVLAISGFGGSGKTTLAQKIINRFSDSTYIELDDFVINRGQGEGWAGGFDWDRFEELLKDMKAGRDLHYQVYDWRKDALSDSFVDEKPANLIIIDGVRMLQPRFMSYFDLSVWIGCDLDTATARGIKRDKEKWQNKMDKEGLQNHLSNWHTLWEPKEEEFYEKFHPDQLADFIYKPE